MSCVWKHFSVDMANSDLAVCKLCKRKISRGKTSHTTSNIRKHLKIHHVREFKNLNVSKSMPTSTMEIDDNDDPDNPDELQSQNSSIVECTDNIAIASCSSASIRASPKRQTTVKELLLKKQKYQPSHPKSRAITESIAKMICKDNQPISIVEDAGFKSLINLLEPRYTMPSRKTISKDIIPDLYNKTKERVKAEIAKTKWVSLTTDLWTSTANDDYISITAHYISQSQLLTHVSLDVFPFPKDAHTSVNIKEALTSVIEEWDLSEKIVAVVRDNGPNIAKAVRDMPYKGLACLSHTLQLVVKEAVLESNTVLNLKNKCQKIVGHFKHSAAACKKLKKFQKQLDLPQHRLVQDEPTRWNSTLHMLKRLLEQRLAIVNVAQNSNLSVELTSNDWDLLKNVVDVLEIFDKATYALSSNHITASEVLAIVNGIRNELEKSGPGGSVIQRLKNELLANLKRRCSMYEHEELYRLCTILDPRLKTFVFRTEEVREEAVNLLTQKADSISYFTSQESSIQPQGQEKGNKTGHAMWPVYSGIISQNKEQQDSFSQSSARIEIEKYLQEPLAPPETNIIKYWAERPGILPELAYKYLCIPPTTVHSERLFSTAGIVVDKKRSRLDPDRVRMLVFLNKNLTN